MGTVDADSAKFDHRHANADFLAAHQGCASSVRRTLNLDHGSRLARLEAALAALGLQVSVSVTKVSPVTASMVA
jgi:hypothetical protein